MTAVLLATAPGRVAAVSTVAVPFHPHATVRLEGAGWGHGVGMSQWGARGRAHAGQSAEQILQAYYPGTQIGQADTAGTQIRVLIDRGFRPPAVDGSRGSSNGLPGDIIGYGGSWQVEGVTGPLPAGARLQMLEQTGGGITVGVINPSGVWIQGFQLPSVLVIKPLEAATRLRAVHKPAGRSEPVPGAYLDTYRGSLVLHARDESQVDTVNVLPLEDYLRGVVPAEMPHHWPAAALQAQAIAARGYALTGLRPNHSMWDIDDTPNHQFYRGANHETESTNAAVDATAGQVLTYAGEPVRPYYFSTSNGYTEASSDQFGGPPLPYLQALPDVDPSGRPWDADSPAGTWRTEAFGLTILGDALRAAAGVALGEIKSLDIRRTDGGRTVRIRVNGTAGSATVSARDFRTAFNAHAAPQVGAIASAHFRIVLGHSLTRPVVPLNLPDGQSRYFEETGHNIVFGFLRYFDANGGVETFGLPLTEEFVLGGRTVQYFEKARFEYHPEHAGTRYEVQLGLLGDELTAARRPFPRAEPIPREPNHRYFPETRQAVHFAFLAYWESQGGLDRFGYPISDEMPENGRTVQYFQRARFEWYPEYGEVRLGSIGSELLRQRGLLP